MSEKDIRIITGSELCDAAGINHSTFYHHCGCPADVLSEIENNVIADLEGLWQKEGAGRDWPLNKRVEALCTHLQEHRGVAKLLCRNSDTNSGFASLLLNAAHVRAIYEQELFHLKNQESKQLIITFLTHGTYHMFRQWILEDIPMAPEEMGELAYFVATQGWAQSSGEKQAMPQG